jgi:hypothetical protein
MMSARWFAVLLGLASACEWVSFGPSGGADDDHGEGPTELTDEALCQRMLLCADQQSPSQLADYLPSYGEGGTCWQTQDSAECRAACRNALRVLYERGDSACNFCEGDRDCPYDLTVQQVCDSTSSCVGCVADEDCTSDIMPWCVLHECTQCRDDEDCPPPDREGQVIDCFQGSCQVTQL